jgi:hypothetical protein
VTGLFPPRSVWDSRPEASFNPNHALDGFLEKRW